MHGYGLTNTSIDLSNHYNNYNVDKQIKTYKGDCLRQFPTLGLPNLKKGSNNFPLPDSLNAKYEERLAA